MGVTKPTVPEVIARSFEEREVERTKVMMKKEEQRLKEKCYFRFIKNHKLKKRFPEYTQKLKIKFHKSATK